ncbi:MAG: response regulator [Acidobacteriota bacterium]|nr:response regulator [Thermoanaerobaculaceae bacterium]
MAKLLVVEDNIVNQKLMRKILESLNHNVFCVTTGEEGWALISSGTTFDLILLDMHLPKMDGFELAKRIKNFLGDRIKIIAVTAMAMSGDKEKILSAGCDDYISKPIFINELKDILEKHLPKEGD